MKILRKIKTMSGYLIYNLVFWFLYFFVWITHKIMQVIKLFFFRIPSGFSRNLNNKLIKAQYKEVVFRTYFPNNFKRKRINQEIFCYVTSKLAWLRRLCFGFSSKTTKFPPNFSLSSKSQGKVFIGFHSLASYSGLLDLAKKMNMGKIGIVAQDYASVNNQLRNNYGVEVSKNQKISKIRGKPVRFFITDNPLRNHSKFTDFLNRGQDLFISYDLPPNFNDLHNLFKTVNQDKPSKFIFYEYNSQKIILVSKYLLYLLERTGSVGIPLYTRRLSDGRDRIVLGKKIEINDEQQLENNSQEIFDEVYDFMSENILASSHGWTNSNNLAKLVLYLRRKKQEGRQDEWDKEYLWKNLQLSSPVLINRYGKERFVLTTTSPVQTIKVDPLTVKAIREIKKSGKLTDTLKEGSTNEKLENTIANLWQAGIIEKID